MMLESKMDANSELESIDIAIVDADRRAAWMQGNRCSVPTLPVVA